MYKKLLDELREYLGPWGLKKNPMMVDVPHLAQDGGDYPVFVFDYLGMPLENKDRFWRDYPSSLRQLVEPTESFFVESFWKDGGLLPIMVVSSDIFQGPFSQGDGLLFLDYKPGIPLAKTPVFYFDSISKGLLHQAFCQSFGSLELFRPSGGSGLCRELQAQGRCYHLAGNCQKAQECYLESVIADPKDGEGYYQLGRLMGPGALAEEFLRMSFLMTPGLGKGRHALAEMLSKRGRKGAAIDLLREAVANNPDDGDAHAFLGDLLGGIGDHHEGLKALEYARKQGVHDPRAKEILQGFTGNLG